jgi:hypothetical protein
MYLPSTRGAICDDRHVTALQNCGYMPGCCGLVDFILGGSLAKSFVKTILIDVPLL